MSTSNSTPEVPSRNTIHALKENTDRDSNVYLGDEGRDALMRGVSKVADAVKGTLGAAGHNVILEEAINPGHIITNDGVSIAKKVKMSDPVENIGANLAKEISQRSDKESGDGTTTSIVLLEAILKEGVKHKASPMEIKRSLDECLPVIFESLDSQKREITPDSVGQVATISAESEKLGALFQEIYQKIGKDGIVELDNSNTFETFYEIKEGVRLRNCGFMAPFMANEGNKAVYLKPKILITKQKIATLADIDPIFRSLSNNGINELVIFCEDIDMSVLGALAYTHIKGIFKTLIIKAPTLWKDWLFEDFAKITGATIVSPETGITWKTLEMSHLGNCDKISTNRDETTVLGIQDVSEHIKQLEEDGKTNDQLLVRVSWLQTKAAVLKLGANSESELSYVRLKAEDARNASHLALKEGIVPGGGVALLNASWHLSEKNLGIGSKILERALETPLRQIMENAGCESANQGGLPINRNNKNQGYDAKTGNVVDMWEAGIVDPVLVVKNAVKNAISVAGTVLTSRVIITIPKDEDQSSM